MSALRILYAPRNIAGQAEMYARAVRARGHHAEVWSFGPPAFGFDADRVIDPGRFQADAGHRWEILDDAVRRFDVLHFQYGRSLLLPQLPPLPPLAELPLLASLNKKLVMNFRGSDVRLRSIHIEREPDSYMHDPSVPCDEERILATISTCRRYCDEMLVSTPGLLDYVPDASWLPHVVDVEWWAAPRGAERAVPRVAHMPSRRSTKSSDVVERAARALEDRGIIEYIPLSDLSRSEVRDAFRDVDIVVDSLAIGDHGLVSVEAMAAGAIAVAHIAPVNRARNPGVPVVEATVNDLEDVLTRLAGDPAERAEIRERSEAWVRAHHTLEGAGALLEDLYRRPAKKRDLSDPAFPIVADSSRIRALEGEVELLRARAANPDRRLRRRTPVERARDAVRVSIIPRLRALAYRTGVARIVVGTKRRVKQRLGR
jgi:hypothetical protein